MPSNETRNKPAVISQIRKVTSSEFFWTFAACQVSTMAIALSMFACFVSAIEEARAGKAHKEKTPPA